MRDLSVELLGTRMPAPVMLAPIGVQTLLHDEGELATARAAAELGLPLITSTASATPLEEIAEANGDAARWFQLYWPNDDELAASLVRRAEGSGYSALVLTVDNYLPGWKPRDLEQAYLPFLEGIGIAQYLSDPVFQAGLEKAPDEDLGAAVGHFLGVFANPDLTWERLEWLRGETTLPIVLKGSSIRTTRARLGSAASTASSSRTTAGGRSTGRSPRSTPCPPIVDAVGGHPVLLDSGIRSGADASRRSRSGPTPCWSAGPTVGAGARRAERRRDRPSLPARRARSDDGALWCHRARRDRLGAAPRDLAGEGVARRAAWIETVQPLRFGSRPRPRASAPARSLGRRCCRTAGVSWPASASSIPPRRRSPRRSALRPSPRSGGSPAGSRGPPRCSRSR